MASKISDGVHVINMDDISSRFSKLLVLFNNGLRRVCIEGLSHPNVQKLLKSEAQYDVIITEMFHADRFLPFVSKFRASHVALHTSSLSTWLNDRTGNPDNPSYVSGTTSGNLSRMNFIQRVDNLLYNVLYKILYQIYNVWCEDVARRHFGRDRTALQDIAKNASLYLVDTHYVHQYAKPLMPNMKEVAGMHVRKPKSLPRDLENWISGASHGLIYLNFSSMINPSSMAEDKRLAFFESFGGLPHRVLMKLNKEDRMRGQPDNVKLTIWVPQNDVLHHPNAKLFISHAMMLRTVEAVHAGVPIVAIPFFGDQLTNAVLFEERGLGISLQYVDITFDTLNRTLYKVFYDPGYAKGAKEFSAVFQDSLVSPLEEAAYWVEYVARHRNSSAANVMRSSALDLPLYQYLLLDVLAFFALLLFVLWMGVRFVGKRKAHQEVDTR